MNPMTNDSAEVSLNRKLRQLIELPEISLTAEEAELFKIQTIDQLTFEELVEEIGEDHHE